MPANEMIRRLKPGDLGGAKVFRAFSGHRPGEILEAAELASIPRANLKALMDQGFIVAWPHGGESPQAILPHRGELHLIQRPGTNRFDVILGEKLNKAPLSKAEAEALADRHRPRTEEDAA